MTESCEITLRLDQPLPAVLTINEAAAILRGEDNRRNRQFVRRLIDERLLKPCKGRRAKGATIYIPAASIREYARHN